MNATIDAILFLRQSDFRFGEADTFEARETKLRAFAASLGWNVAEVIVENDVTPDGRRKSASAYKRKRIQLPNGRTELRTVRPGFRKMIDALANGTASAVLCEDLDRFARQPRDLEDLLDTVEMRGAHARSLSGSITLTAGGTDAERMVARVMCAMASKSSADTARRVADARERQANEGRWGGGIRPFGFEKNGITINETEAAVIRHVAKRLLQNATLRSLAAELRAGDVGTVSGKPWTSQALRSIMLRPRIAGLRVHRAEIIGPGPWDPIISRDTFDAVTRLLTAPDRRTSPGTAPRWLLSCVAVCGVCGGTVWAAGMRKSGRLRYRCSPGCVARSAHDVDQLVLAVVGARLTRPDAVDLLARPTVPAAVDVAALRAEADAVRRNLAGIAEDRALGLLTREDHLAGAAAARDRLAEIDAKLATATVVDHPLAEIITADDVTAALKAAPLSVQRQIVSELVTVKILRMGRGKRSFDPASVEITWNAGGAR